MANSIYNTEIKNQSLQNFLNSSLDRPAGYRQRVFALHPASINGKKCTVLKATDLARLSVPSLVATLIRGNASLPKVLAFIKEQWPLWTKEKLSVREMRDFELQCFFLERKVKKYNANHPDARLHFKNPYKGILHITVRHPSEVGAKEPTFKQSTHEYKYDRWALNNGLVAKAIAFCKKKPVGVQVSWKEAVNQDEKKLLIEVEPSSCFKKCEVFVENESELNTEGQYHFPLEKKVTITFDDPDAQALNGAITETVKRQFVCQHNS